LDGINDGNISALVVADAKGKESALPKLEALESFLSEARKTAANKGSVQLRPESRLKVAALIEAIDACLKAGFPSVILGAPPDTESEPKFAARQTVPDAAAQASAEKDIKSLYATLYAQPDAADLAGRLQQAGNICDEPVARFVLLREAADAADRAGNFAASID